MLTTVFVSSTFRDMHRERDALHVRVMPAVNAEARRYGDAVSMCDLRWGIDTAALDDKQSAHKVLQVCLDEIDRCRPYMIVILGYRYGWMPGGELIRETAKARSPFAPQDEDISVTALEIEYGALDDPEKLAHTLFYFREVEGPCSGPWQQEDALHRQKLDALRQRIQSLPGAHLRTYRVHQDDSHPGEMDAFADMVTADLMELLRSRWDENAGLDRYALDQKRQWDHAREKSAQFTARGALCDRILDRLTAGTSAALVGAPGSGKSTLTARLALRLRDQGCAVVPVFCGNTAIVGAGSDLVRCAVWTLENALGAERHLEDTLTGKDNADAVWLEYLHEMIRQYDRSDRAPLYFLFDGLDQLRQDDIASELSFLPREGAGAVRFFVSAVSFAAPPEGLARFEAASLPPDEREQVVAGVLSAQHRELSAPVIAAILAKQGSQSPLYISLIIQRLVMLDREDFAQIHAMGDGIEAITRYQLRLIEGCPGDASALSAQLLDAASRQVGGDAMRRAMLYIAASRHGLRLSDLEALLTADGVRWIPLDAAAFLQYMGGAFILRSDGRVDFSHRTIRQGILGRAEPVRALHRAIIAHLEALPPEDELNVQELVWQVIQADMKDAFCDALIRMKNAKVPMTQAIADTAECALADGGRWLIDTVMITAPTPGFSFFSHFLLNDVWFTLFDSAGNLATKQRIAEAVLESTRLKREYEPSNGLDWDITIACERLISLHQGFHTPEHTREAVRYGRMLLESREAQIGRYQGLDTPQKRRAQFEADQAAAGLRVTQQVTDAQIQQVLSMLNDEFRRGIDVAQAHLAGALAAMEERDSLEEARRLLEACVADKREQLDRRLPSYGTMSRDDSALELATILCKLSRVCCQLGGEESLERAQQACQSALGICREQAERDPSDERRDALCDACMEYARLQLARQDGDLDEAIRLCLECEDFLSRQDTRERSPWTADKLALLYDLMGSLFRQKGDPQSLSAAEECYGRSHFFTAHVFSKTKALSAADNLAIIKRKLSGLHGTLRGGAGADEIAMLADAYASARQGVAGRLTPNACGLVNDALKALIENVNGPAPFFAALPAELRRRVAEEAELQISRNQWEAGDLDEDQLRRLVGSLNQCADALAEGEAPAPDAWPGETLDMLARFGLTRDLLCAKPALRAYAASGLALKIHRELCRRTGTDRELENLAVSLMYYGRHCFMVNPEEARAINEETLQLADGLYRKSGHEQLATIIAGARMLQSLFSQHQGGWEHADRSEAAHAAAAENDALSDLRRQKADLERALEACTGSGTSATVRRCKLIKQLEDVERRLNEAAAAASGADAQAASPSAPTPPRDDRRQALERERQDVADQLEALGAGGVAAIVKRHKLKQRLAQIEQELKAL